jgi:hypothetical protein
MFSMRYRLARSLCCFPLSLPCAPPFASFGAYCSRVAKMYTQEGLPGARVGHPKRNRAEGVARGPAHRHIANRLLRSTLELARYRRQSSTDYERDEARLRRAFEVTSSRPNRTRNLLIPSFAGRTATCRTQATSKGADGAMVEKGSLSSDLVSLGDSPATLGQEGQICLASESGAMLSFFGSRARVDLRSWTGALPRGET